MPLIILWPTILFFRATCFSLSDFHTKLAVLEPFLVWFDLANCQVASYLSLFSYFIFLV